MMSLRVVLLLSASICLFATAVQGNELRNPSFEEGDATPAFWQLNGGTGGVETPGHTGERCLAITGDGSEGSVVWTQQAPVLPGQTYRFSFWARSAPGTAGGCVVSGPAECNDDTNVGVEWEQRSFVFTTDKRQTQAIFRLGHWSKKGTVYFDDVNLAPVLTIHRFDGGVMLGEGEGISKGNYRFSAPLAREGHNHCRVLWDHTAGFNTNRWVFGPGAYVVYKLSAGDTPQTGATVKVDLGYYNGGHCVIEAGRDGREYVEVGRLSKSGAGEFTLPEALFPADEVYLRLLSPGEQQPREEADPGSFQVTGFDYKATLAGFIPDAIGHTRYMDVDIKDPRIAMEVLDLGDMKPGVEDAIEIALTNKS